MKTYKDYVIKEKQKEFIEHCKDDSTDFYSCGIILTAHLVMGHLMEYLDETPKEAWNKSMAQTPYHSGYSAAATAVVVAKYSLRGDEFKEWCIKDKVVMVEWGEKENGK